MRMVLLCFDLLWLCCVLLGIPVINSLAPGRPRCHFKTAIFNIVLLIGIFTSSKDNALRWMLRDLIDDKSTLIQVMAWCRQATSHYLSQCWPSSMSPYDITRPQWVNLPYPSGRIPVFNLSISFRVTSLALGQSYDCPSASKVTLQDMHKINHYLTTTEHNKVRTMCIILGVYCVYQLVVICGICITYVMEIS